MGDQRIQVTRLDQAVAGLVYAQRRRIVGKFARLILRLIGVDVPTPVPIGPGLRLPHSTTGFVLHPDCEVGTNVTLWHGSTVGRADVWRPAHPDTKVVIGDDVILGAHAVVLVKAGQRINVAPGTIVGANSVLVQSTGPGEVWAGNPARCVGSRDQVAY